VSHSSLFRPQLIVAALAIGGCASAHSTTPANPSTSPTATSQLGPGLLQLTGRFQPILQQSGDATSPHARNKVTGTIKLTAAAMGRTTAEITVSTPVTTPTDLRWAIVNGACGSGAIPLLPVDEFPTIRVSSTGDGTLAGDVATPLPTAGTFHANLYWTDGRDEGDVMGCANLRIERRR
jgi:hypothetical protein